MRRSAAAVKPLAVAQCARIRSSCLRCPMLDGADIYLCGLRAHRVTERRCAKAAANLLQCGQLAPITPPRYLLICGLRTYFFGSVSGRAPTVTGTASRSLMRHSVSGHILWILSALHDQRGKNGRLDFLQGQNIYCANESTGWFNYACLTMCAWARLTAVLRLPLRA